MTHAQDLVKRTPSTSAIYETLRRSKELRESLSRPGSRLSVENIPDKMHKEPVGELCVRQCANCECQSVNCAKADCLQHVTMFRIDKCLVSVERRMFSENNNKMFSKSRKENVQNMK